jgi:hypothetical protein
MRKPVSPTLHGAIDYVLTGVMLAAPSLLGLNNKVRNTYLALGSGFGAVDAFTDTGAGIRRLMPFRMHQKLDLSFLAGLSVLSLINPIRKDRRALYFHVAVLATAITHYLLTDYKSRR